LDVTDHRSISAAAELVAHAASGRRLAGLVNNAGIAVWGPLEFTSIETLRHQLDVNVVGQVAVTQAFLPLLRQGCGRIVNVGSVSGVVALPFLGAYCASKSALEAITDSLRLELRGSGIAVAMIEAGAIATSILTKSLASFDEINSRAPAECQRQYGSVLEALRRRVEKVAGEPAEKVARAVAHALLARRPKTRYVVGRGVRAQLALRWLPDKIRDWLIARKLPHTDRQE
jgi:NAD(P)-dependent dehydrogenase (short-subunit alcohol dehydrogenase family)